MLGQYKAHELIIDLTRRLASIAIATAGLDRNFDELEAFGPIVALEDHLCVDVRAHVLRLRIIFTSFLVLRVKFNVVDHLAVLKGDLLVNLLGADAGPAHAVRFDSTE